MRKLWSTLWLLGLLALVAPAAAQEVQVALDEAGRVETVDLALAQRLGLWVQEYPGFREARLFQDAASGFVLEITTQQGGQLRRERVPLSAAEAAQLRSEVSARLAERAPAVALNQEGRYLLMGQTTLAGVMFYGWALPYLLDIDDQGAAATYLLTAAGSFFVPLVLTQNRPVTFGMANLSRYGVTRGIIHGALLHRVVAGAHERCDDFHCHEEEPLDSRASVASAMAVSMAEGVGGYLWARNERMSAGTANTIVTLGDAGLLWGVGLGSLAGVNDSERAGAGLALGGAVAGVMAGRSLAARRSYTWGDADLLYTAGVLGAYTGVAATELVDVEESRVFTGMAMLGSAAGMYVADRLVRETDFTVGQATLNRLGTVAGGLAGASIGVLAESGRAAIAGSALGAIAGYMGTYAMLAPQAREQTGERFSSWDVQLTPHALLLRGGGAGAWSDVPTPLLSVRYRFGAR